MNVSTRAEVGDGEMIGGFIIITGSQQAVLLLAICLSLADFGIQCVL